MPGPAARIPPHSVALAFPHRPQLRFSRTKGGAQAGPCRREARTRARVTRRDAHGVLPFQDNTVELLPLMNQSSRNQASSRWRGDCGHFAVWRAALYYGRNVSLKAITHQISPLVLFTGPITIQRHLARLGIRSTLYNSFSAAQIRQKLDEAKPVIAMINTNTAALTDGLTHYLFVVDYDDHGFYFYDSYYWPGAYHKEKDKTKPEEPYFMDFSEFESRRQSVLQPRQLVGRLESIVGMEKFVIVVDERRKEAIGSKIMLVLGLQYVAERLIEGVGRVAMFLSRLGRSR